MSSEAAEKKVKKLARLPGNSVCANCGTSKKFGFSTVCIKFHTFVCSNCKSSHQAISHRCKSLTMSSWTDVEVAELEAKGNDYCRRTWLKHAPPVGTGGRPKEGDHIAVFKGFVVDAYERKRYYGEDDGAPRAAPTQQRVATAIPLSHAGPAEARRPPPRAMPSVSAPLPPDPAPTQVSDLLDFTSGSPAPAPASFRADFDAFGSSPTPAPAPSGGSAFGFISAPPAAATSPAPESTPGPVSSARSGFAFISKPPAATPAPAPSSASISNDFADFAGMTISTPSSVTVPARPEAKKPVMSLASNGKASLISSMDNTSGHYQQGMGYGGAGGMMPQQQGGLSNMGTSGVNTGNMSQQQKQQQMMMQQMMMMQQQGISMAGMNMNSNLGMVNNTSMMGGSGGMNSGMGIGMMTPQQMMNFGGGGGQGNKNPMNNSDAMSSLSMSGMDVNAWTTGKK